MVVSVAASIIFPLNKNIEKGVESAMPRAWEEGEFMVDVVNGGFGIVAAGIGAEVGAQGAALLDETSPTPTQDSFVDGQPSFPITGPGQGGMPTSYARIKIATPDEMLGGGDWRRQVLPQILRANRMSGPPLAAALFTLKDATASLSLKLIALRVIEDHRAGLDSDSEMYARTLRRIAEILDDKEADPNLRGMAYRVLDQICCLWSDYRGWHRGPIGYLRDLWTRAREPVLYPKSRMKRLEKKDLGEDLYDSIDYHLSERHSQFDPYPLWSSILPEVLGIVAIKPVSVEALRDIASSIFSDNQNPFYKKAVALVYYELLIPNQKPTLDVLTNLRTMLAELGLDEEGVCLRRMAVSVYEKVLEAWLYQVIDKDQPRLRDDAALARVEAEIGQLRAVIPSDPTVGGRASYFVKSARARLAGG